MTSTPFLNLSFDDALFPREEVDSVVHQKYILTDAQIWTLTDISTTVGIAIGLVGIPGNILIIRGFLRMGLEDCVTIGFFNLTISDLIYLILELVRVVAGLYQSSVKYHPREYTFALSVILLVGKDVTRMFINSTVMLTTFLAVQRCMCVLFPLHFKGMFTRHRTFLVMSAIWGYCLIFGGIKVLSYGVRDIMVPSLNSSFPQARTKPSFYPHMMNWVILNYIIVNPFCQLLVATCTLVITYVLKRSVQFRKTTSISRFVSTTPKDPDGSTKLDENKTNEGETSAKTNSKEQQAIVQVSLVSAILFITNIPIVTLAFLQLLFPQTVPTRYVRLVQRLFVAYEERSSMLNSAINFLIYYKYNTKFRQVCFK